MSRVHYTAERRAGLRQALRSLGQPYSNPVNTGSRYQLIDTVTGEVVSTGRHGSYKRQTKRSGLDRDTIIVLVVVGLAFFWAFSKSLGQ